MVVEAVEYYRRIFGENVQGAFVHVVRELGELARAVERDQGELAIHEITEIAALMGFLASLYGFDLEAGISDLYSKKLRKLESG